MSEPATVAIPGSLIDDLVAEGATVGAPLEQCGLLIGRPGVVIPRIRGPRNADAAASRYTVEPADHFQALRSAQHDGLDVIGV